MIPRVCTIAGSDSGGGAGIQADLKTFSAFGVYGMSVITAVTAQNTVKVNGIESLSPQFVSLQFESILTDIGIDALKTGMLFSAEVVQEIARKIEENPQIAVVVDPVMVSTSGHRLMEEPAVEIMRKTLIPLATLVTPNMDEAALLTGREVTDLEGMKQAAKGIMDWGCGAVLVKGGHLEDEAVDVLFDGEAFHFFSAPHLDTLNTHGTGCTYSAAIAASLAKGHPLLDAIRISKRYVTEAIRSGFSLGKGHGPLNHLIRVPDDSTV